MATRIERMMPSPWRGRAIVERFGASKDGWRANSSIRFSSSALGGRTLDDSNR